MAEALTAEAPNAVIADEGLVYCRFPNGEIAACDSSPMELMKKINRGITPLNDYGQFGSNVYYMEHPYEPLFQAGGAHELSVDQIITLGYHLRPPLVPTCEQHVGQGKDHLMHRGRPGGGSAKAQGCWRGARPVRFPQLERIAVPEAPEECEFCARDDFPTQKALKQHQDVMHNDRRQQQQLGEAIVSGLHQTGVVGGSGVDAQAIAAAVAATLQALGYGTRQTPGPDPVPGDEEEDDDQPEAPEPQPAPQPEPTAQRPVSGWARDRARAAARGQTSDN
jgi:hypothetical protein